jgi:transcriptional regulator with XRE-family HTH domain
LEEFTVNTNSRIGQRIEQLLKSKKINRLRLSRDTGVPYSTITQIINGRTKDPQLSSLEKIADYFEVSVDYLRGESILAIIEKRLSELNMSVKDLVKSTDLPEGFFLGIDTLTPEPWDYEDGELIDRIAKALKMDPRILANAYSRQEPPAYDGPQISAEEAFKDVNFEIDEPKTVAAHFDEKEFTPEELEEIKEYAKYLKSKRKG